MSRKRPKPVSPLAPRPSWSEHGEAAGLSLSLTVLLFSGVWGKALFLRDLSIWTYPGLWFYKQSLLSGELPLWNPGLCLGYPFLAELANSAVFYPLSVVHLLLPLWWSLEIYPALHYLLAGYLMWRLLREWGLSQLSSLFGAVVWCVSGYLVCMHLLFNYLNIAFYPGLIFCWHRLLLSRQMRWLLLTCLCWALFFLGGDPQGFIFAGALLVLYAAVGVPHPSWSGKNLLALISLAGSMTVLLLLAQALPSFELGALTTKLEGFDFNQATFWSHSLWRILEWIWPELWGPAYPEENFWGHFLRVFTTGTWAELVYIGLFPLGLALLHFRCWREKPVGFLILSFAVWFLLALGYYSPLFRLLWAVAPPYRIFRYPEKHLAVATFALAALAGFAFQRRVEEHSEVTQTPWLRAWTVFTAVLAAVFLLWLIFSSPLSHGIADFLHQRDHSTVVPLMIRRSLLQSTGRSAVVAGVFLLVFFLAKRLPAFQRETPLILLFLTAADLLQVGRRQLVGTNPAFYDFKPVAGRLIHEAEAGGNEKFRIFRAKNFPGPASLPYPQTKTLSEQVHYWQKDTLTPNTNLPEGLESFFGWDPAELSRFRIYRSRPPRLLTLQMLNVKYLLDGLVKGELQAFPQLQAIAQEPSRNLVVYGNHGYFPRAFFVDGVVAARDEAEALDWLNSADLTTNVILVNPPEGARPGRLILPAEITRYQNREVVLTITNPVAGHLVLSDSYFPGWTAEVDRKPVRILLANYLVRAVPLSAGAHEVVFRYRPWSWRIGKTVSLFSLGWLLATVLYRRPRTSP